MVFNNEFGRERKISMGLGMSGYYPSSNNVAQSPALNFTPPISYHQPPQPSGLDDTIGGLGQMNYYYNGQGGIPF